jgi:hypothetical protein
MSQSAIRTFRLGRAPIRSTYNSLAAAVVSLLLVSMCKKTPYTDVEVISFSLLNPLVCLIGRLCLPSRDQDSGPITSPVPSKGAGYGGGQW